MKTPKTIILIAFFFYQTISAGTIDSLKSIVNNLKSDSAKARAYFKICYYAYYSQPESLAVYVGRTMKYAKTAKLYDLYLRAKNMLGYYNVMIGNNKKAIQIFKENIKFAKAHNDTITLPAIYGNLANSYVALGQYDSAIFYFNQALKMFEHNNNLPGIATAYGALGNLYLKNKQYNEAIDYYTKAYNIYKQLYDKTHDLNYLNYMGLSQMNKGLAYKRLKNVKLGKKYLQEARKLFILTKDSNSLNQCNANLADIYFINHQYEKAINYSWQAVNFFQKAGLYNDLLISAFFIAQSYDSIGQYKKELKTLSWAKPYLDSVKLDPQFVRTFYHSLASAFAKNNMIDSAYLYLQKAYDLTDSLLDYRIKANVEEAIEKFKTQQKQKQIELLKKQKALQQKTIRFQKLLLIVFISAFLVFLIYSLILVRLVRKIRRQNKQLQELNAEIIQQKEEILSQKEILEQQNRHITESIQYASRIQHALLPDISILKKIFPQNFVLFKPKSYVSGDFYWFYHYENKIIITVADCTGHGVPGSLMTTLGISLLNEIVKTKKFSNAAEILNTLRTFVKQSLSSKSADYTVTQDGMDMALLIIETDTLKANFAGAYNPLVIIDKDKLMEIKADKMPVGAFVKEKPGFTNHELQLKPNQMIYMFSDGFSDQFGGPEGKKYLYKNLKKLLLKISHLPTQQQYAILEAEFENWKNGYKQIDDVTILGVRISKTFSTTPPD